MNLPPQRPKPRRQYRPRNPQPPPPIVPPAQPRGASRRPDFPPAHPTNQSTANPDEIPSDPVRDEFEALLRELPRHPDFSFDTPGAGSSRLDNPLDRPPTFPPPGTQNIEDPARIQEAAEPWLAGLSTEERMRMEMEAQLADSGGRKLTETDLLAIRGFNYKIDTGITSRAYGKLPQAFPELERLPTEARMKTRMEILSGTTGVYIDCCEDSCVAFTGNKELLKECPRCGKDRYEQDPNNLDRLRPKRTFFYMPAAPRLANLFRDPDMAEKMSYRAEFQPKPGVTRDIFDGTHYQHLRDRRVWTAHESFDHKYFSAPTDIALGLSTDGYGPFKKRKSSCWPLILFNYNLPPAIRFHLEHILCLGVIPGPKEPKDIGSFLQPLIDELDDLAAGVPAWDSVNKRPFCLRAYLIACFGDMPAVAKLMCMKGPGGKRPCRACNILGTQHPNGKYYVALNRPFADNPEPYDPLNLPLRTHHEYLAQASQVHSAPSDTVEDERGMRFGINSLSPLTDVPSLGFPTSFPHDFMHLMFQNVILTLLKLWTRSGKYWDFGTGREDYLIGKTAWDAIGEACAASGNTIPAIFGCRVPNLAEKSGFLVRLINLCTAFEITDAGLQEVRHGFAEWVQEYEKLYYREKSDRLRACTLPIHALLHIADDIRNMGPVWAYWAFPMERFNGSLAHANLNCRFVWASLDRHLLEVTQLSQIKLIFGLKDALSLEEERYNIATGAHYESYPGLVFVRPTRTTVLHSTIIKKVARYVSIELDADERIVRNVIERRQFVLWGRMQQIDDNRGGDLVRGHFLSPCRERISRDASYVKYATNLDRWNRRSPRELDRLTFSYGRAEVFIVIDTDFIQDVCDAAGIPNTRLDPLILAAVSPIPTFRKNNESNMVQFELNGINLAVPEIVDVNNIDCLVGRMQTHKGDRYIVERSNVVGRMNLLDTMMDLPVMATRTLLHPPSIAPDYTPRSHSACSTCSRAFLKKRLAVACGSSDHRLYISAFIHDLPKVRQRCARAAMELRGVLLGAKLFLKVLSDMKDDGVMIILRQ
ncbi:Transposase family tnp2 [Ceratobasidium sp. AG-Ba]|nr:Transposase family tnp2 [Ceratobasidium sp. AG-Ba]